MIFFFGTRTAHLNTVQDDQAICQNCQTQGALQVHIYRSHFHLFWIPLFPLTKKGYTECQHCKNVLKPKEMSLSVKDRYTQIKKDSKGPIWQYSGLIIIVLFIAFITILAITH